MRVLYVDLDCCRADHLGINGYHRNTSPNIDEIARQGITFTQAHCANSPCVPSRASFFSGRFGINNGVVAHHGVGEQFRPISHSHWYDPEKPMLARHLWANGMKTVAFSTFAERHNAWWFADGWEELHTFSRWRGNECAHDVNHAFVPWFQQHCKEDNWFIHLHYWDIHRPYRVPDEWMTKFKDEEAPAWPDDEAIARHQDFYGPRTALDLHSPEDSMMEKMPPSIRNREDFKQVIDGYDGSIAYADHHVGMVLNILADAGILDDTVVIFSADHGDSFGECGHYSDHGIANRAVHNIPMIIKWPGMPGGQKCDELVYGLDLCPTLCDLLGFRTPAKWDGKSFADAVRGKDFKGWDYQVWDHGIYTFTRSIRTKDHLLINMLHPGMYPYDDPCYLFDLNNDPHEQTNIASERPDLVGQMQGLLAEWKQEQLLKGAAPDPMEAMVSEGPFTYWDPAMMARQFDRTGRSHLKEDLKKRLQKFHGNKYDVVLSQG